MKNILTGFVIPILVILGAVTTARAAEYCVSCLSPDANYNCVVGTAQTASDPRGWLLCVTELAKQGGHESCSVARNAQSPCAGIQKVLAAPEGPPPAPDAPEVEAGTPAPTPEPNAENPASPTDDAKAAAKKAPPQTVEELASETIDASKESLKKAGDTVSTTAKKAGDAVTGTAKSAGEKIGEAGSAVGNAAKKTWGCLTSLFQDC